ncbi:chemotaxis response regulator protein-glutamate methylesterase [Geobacter sp. SVR]|uniref:protein-glutamate methylesterase/protein-glutamine glutaminase n=1 Tax=Geobacter sp. SVR TaxID=2495594 RepID=UPI00143EF557|nr:chemotaxis response regulator protein-glutamate methylesterase [Geobacter sp. SVR]BCS54904.1 chemotaxis response regulator protein-glutamate methylesterase of group 1 operon [Geobacter sp. SVR]GCF87422.1 chemotaxis response regulator protein-glutamate methylesterase of group 1 operon [Geobacter sp. SVR]
MLSSPSGKIRVLIVDDSSFMRMAIRGVLSKDPSIEVVGTAVDGVEGVEKALALKPDLITMDVEMPRMDGIAALRQIMAKAPTKVIMVSTLTNEGAKATFEALDAGAIDYIPKNVTDSAQAQTIFRDELLRKVKDSVRSRFGGAAPIARPAMAAPVRRVSTPLRNKKINYVGIGASTGGPVALQEVLSRIPVNFPYGIVVGIHMPKAFTGPYAERLNAKCSLSIREAVDGDVVKPGLVLIAPGGMHTTLVRQGTNLVVKVVPTSAYPQYVYIPSVDLILSTMAEVTNGSMLGVILTGMGNDGFKGMQLLKSKGGVTIAQDEATSTIYGMPKACVDGGVADEVLPLGQIGYEIAKFAG